MMRLALVAFAMLLYVTAAQGAESTPLKFFKSLFTANASPVPVAPKHYRVRLRRHAALPVVPGPDLAHDAKAPTKYLHELLQWKLADIQMACTGFHVVNTIYGPHPSKAMPRVGLYFTGDAADFVVDDYECAYRQLVEWDDMSGDPVEIGHLHISIGGNEGRFCHAGHAGRGCRYAGLARKGAR